MTLRVGAGRPVGTLAERQTLRTLHDNRDDRMSSDSEPQTPEAANTAAGILKAWRDERDRAGIEAGAPIAERLGPPATAAGGRPLTRPVTGWRYTQAGRIRPVVIAEELDGWEFPDGSALMLEPEPCAEPAPDGRQIAGAALRAWREREGLTVAEAAERVSVAANTWHRWEKDGHAPAGPARVLLADLLATLERPARRGRRRR